MGNHLPWPAVLDHPLWTTSIFFALAAVLTAITVALYLADGAPDGSAPTTAPMTSRDATALTGQGPSIAVSGDVSVATGGTFVIATGTEPAGSHLPPRRPQRDRAFEVPRPADSRPFAGRDDELDWIHRALHANVGVAAITQTRAIAGLGGVGKSRLAREYALRHRDDYDVVWWVRAEAGATRDADFGALARHLGVVGDDAPPRDAVAATRAWLADHARWLLVFDNAEAPDEVLDMLPAAVDGHVLVTTRRTAEWEAVSPAMRLDVLKRPDSIALLVARSGDGDTASADELADALGDLPLALEQAAAYCLAKRVSLVGYLQRFRERAPELLAEGTPVDYPATVATAWSLAFDELRSDAPGAANLLALCSLLAPDGIPRDLFRSAPADWPVVGRLADRVSMDSAVAALVRYSLAEATDRTITVHRLVQQVTRHRLQPAQRGAIATLLLGTVRAAFPDVRLMPAWSTATALLPHASAILRATEADPATAPVRAELQNVVGIALANLGRREPALTAIQEAVDLCRNLAATRPDAYRPELAGSLTNLSNALTILGRREPALAAAEEAVDLYRDLAAANPDRYRPYLATSLNNLANALNNLGRRERGLTVIEEAVRLYRVLAATDPDAYRPDLAGSLNNLSDALRDLGRPSAALTAAKEAFTLFSELAAAHPDVYSPDLAGLLNNLSNALDNLGRPELALTAIEEAVRLYRDLAATYPGAYRPDLAMSVNNLSAVLRNLGQPEPALTAAEEAVGLYRELAATHPDVYHRPLGGSLHNLSNTLADLGQPELALTAIEEAVGLFRNVATAHPDAYRPDLAMSLNSLADVLRSLERPEPALIAIEEAVAIRRDLAAAHPDANNPDLIRSLNNLATVLDDLGRHEEARNARHEADRLSEQQGLDD